MQCVNGFIASGEPALFLVTIPMPNQPNQPDGMFIHTHAYMIYQLLIQYCMLSSKCLCVRMHAPIDQQLLHKMHVHKRILACLCCSNQQQWGWLMGLKLFKAREWTRRAICSILYVQYRFLSTTLPTMKRRTCAICSPCLYTVIPCVLMFLFEHCYILLVSAGRLAWLDAKDPMNRPLNRETSNVIPRLCKQMHITGTFVYVPHAWMLLSFAFWKVLVLGGVMFMRVC